MVPVLSWITYLHTSLLTCLLSFVVRFFITKKNKKINMVESLKGIDIPESVTNVNSGALEGCSSLEYVHFSVNTKINKIDSSVFVIV